MRVRLLFFATLKDIIGAREMRLEVPAGATVADVLTHLEGSYPRVKDYRPVVLTNPNTSVEVTDLLVSAGRAAAAPGTELIPLTAPRGVPYIASRAEAQIGGTIALEMLASVPDLDVLIVPIGGGGLISGIAVAAKTLKPDIEIVGVQAALYPSMYNLIKGESLPMRGISKRFAKASEAGDHISSPQRQKL